MSVEFGLIANVDITTYRAHTAYLQETRVPSRTLGLFTLALAPLCGVAMPQLVKILSLGTCSSSKAGRSL
jgi:hypothetical protein